MSAETREQTRIMEEQASREEIARKQAELENTKIASRESQEKASNLKSAFNADRKMLQDKIYDLEKKLSNRYQEVQSLEQKIHMLCQAESSQKNELNFWNGKVTTLRRDLEY